MDNNSTYEIYVLISSKKFVISVNSNLHKKIYKEDLYFDTDNKSINFEKLDYFLSENIFRIEKKLKNFINKVIVIIDLDIFFHVELSVNKKNYENYINLKSLNYLLHEARECSKMTMNNNKIIHMVIKNYQVDRSSYTMFPKDIKCKDFSLHVKFISISEQLVKDLEKIFKKYQISLTQIISGNYVNQFMLNDENDTLLMAEKIKNGYNPNEVILAAKTLKKQGFFEKFFNFFN